MKKSYLATLALILPGAAQAAVNVEWTNPENYRDAYSSYVKSEKSRQVVLDQLESFIKEVAAPRLGEGENLEIRVTDLDLAGEYEPWNEKQKDVRIIRAPYFARIVFDYTLTDKDGNIVAQGTEKLRNDLLLDPLLPDRNELAPYLRSTLRNWLNGNVR